MNPEFDTLPFEMFGLQLQEPMALVTTWCIAIFAIYAYRNLPTPNTDFLRFWKKFYFFLAIGMFCGGLGHMLFGYSGIYGKMPAWTFGVLAGVAATLAMFSLVENQKLKRRLIQLSILESFAALTLSIATQKFIFVAVDTILTYLLGCGAMAFYFYKKGFNGIDKIFVGVLILIPSAFIFLFKIDLHKYLNRDDLSHVLMLVCMIFFYMGVKVYAKSQENSLSESQNSSLA